jgi:hypothetical protein
MNLYLVGMRNHDSGESFYKIGVTGHRNVLHRFTKHGDENRRIQTSCLSKLDKLRAAFGGHEFLFPYKITMKHMVVFDSGEDAEAVEDEILGAVAPARYQPKIEFSGWTECFVATDDQLALVIDYMNQRAAETRVAMP